MEQKKFHARIISSLEKCFCDEPVEIHPALSEISMLQNERLSFQLVYCDERPLPAEVEDNHVSVETDAPEALHCTWRTVEQLAVMMPVYQHSHDENYLRTTPGLFPDLLLPLRNHNTVRPQKNVTAALWFDLDPQGEMPAGTYPLTVRLRHRDSGTVLAEETLQLTVIGASLPEQSTLCTQWFYADCLADYYRVPVFSEEHWQIIENYLRTAVKNGINTLLTPIVTPPLDTEVGSERPTVQLIDITVQNGKYSFAFDKLDRWVELAQRCGITHFEMAHLFTQWGVAHAPKIVARVDGEMKRIFGWETEAASDEYAGFLRAMLPELTAHLKELGIADRCIFHISDEPHHYLDAYKKAHAIVDPLLKDFPIMDALSDVEYYLSGTVEHPVPALDHIGPFLEAKVPGLWTYYCCSQNKTVSNRFIAMPSARNRILGTQMYKFNIAGFLHWGYNFFYSQFSVDNIEPYQTSDGDYFAPAGDTFSVYPAQNGTAHESLRLKVFYDALQDQRAMQLCEQLCGREKVLALIEEGCTDPLTCDNYPHEASYILELREKINAAIAAAL